MCSNVFVFVTTLRVTERISYIAHPVLTIVDSFKDAEFDTSIDTS